MVLSCLGKKRKGGGAECPGEIVEQEPASISQNFTTG